jgi:8-oxo-dGTP pyrophosphatase MutT (NUDIX family)
MRNRSGIILIENNKLALIERQRNGLHYFAFPGGGIDEGESPEQAAVREAEEELGVVVEVQQKAAEVFINGNTQHYFLVSRISGDFGTGTGEEFGEYNPAHGTYLPLWISIENVLSNNVLPRELAELVVRCTQAGWPRSSMQLFLEQKS